MAVKMFIASDHAGTELKARLQVLLPEIQWQDLGPAVGQSVDYPEYAGILCKKIQSTPNTEGTGILICGSGIGMSIAANRFPGIRAALVENPVSARLAKEHNGANVLCLGARFLAPEYAIEIVHAWIHAKVSDNPRHLNRIRQLG